MSPNKRQDSHKPQSSTRSNGFWPYLAIAAIIALIFALGTVITRNIRDTEQQQKEASEFADHIRAKCAYVGGGFHNDFDRGYNANWISIFACPDGKLAIIPQS